MPMRAGVSAGVNIAAIEQRIILAMGGDELAEAHGLPHGAAHHSFALHAPAIVRKGDGIGSHSRHISQSIALFTHCNGPVWQHAHHGVPLDYGKLLLQCGKAIRHGV